MSTSPITGRHQDLPQAMKASFSQSEEAFYRSHITSTFDVILNYLPYLSTEIYVAGTREKCLKIYLGLDARKTVFMQGF